MLRPIIDYAFKAAVFYQGENEAAYGVEEASEYCNSISDMINEWRFYNGNQFPFFIVMLAGHGDEAYYDKKSNWSILRGQQLKAASTVADCYISSAVDCGEAKDIHPRNKKTVGVRMGKLLLDKLFSGADGESPSAAEVAVRCGNDVVIELKNAGSQPLSFKGEKVSGICGINEDGSFVELEIEVLAGKLIAKNVDSNIRKIAYLQADYPTGTVLYKETDLPLFPFLAEVK
jgi:sialate O-acetylesterase